MYMHMYITYYLHKTPPYKDIELRWVYTYIHTCIHKYIYAHTYSLYINILLRPKLAPFCTL